MNPHACPHCGVVHTAATGLGHKDAPEDGDLSLCMECGAFSFFDKGQLRMPTEEENRKIGASAKLQFAQFLMKRAKLDHPLR